MKTPENGITVAMLPTEILVERLKEAKYNKSQIREILERSFDTGYEDKNLAVTYSTARGGIFVVVGNNPLYNSVTKLYKESDKNMLDKVMDYQLLSTGKLFNKDELKLIKLSFVDDKDEYKLINLLVKELILQDILARI